MLGNQLSCDAHAIPGCLHGHHMGTAWLRIWDDDNSISSVPEFGREPGSGFQPAIIQCLITRQMEIQWPLFSQHNLPDKPFRLALE